MVGPGKAKEHEGTEGHRKIQSEKPLNPHLTSTNSTIASKMPSVGKQKVPPELITSIEPDFVPKDSVPENTERMTGGTQKGVPDSGLNANIKAGETSNGGELGVGELQGGEFRVEPLRRSGEDGNTMRARLLYQSRKRGTLESDLLMSTFAEAHLRDMTLAQMTQYDRFLDENDWDIYYWATQEPTPTSQETAEGAGREPEGATANASGLDKSRAPKLETDDEWRQGKPRSGEWAQTVGTFKPAYRPVPARWKNTEILAMLRRHVISRSAGGVLSDDSLSQDVKKPRGGG
ncbi:putative succinate dehydrogenase assembly factor 2, mitochondrial [Amylocarpus encephaloides]|uniref:Succinate dehydrogenase assembly factor 2, mitochondrial n=1 Tax=Amylocarpus encephaloides TaxID=45428 RepID=A0A9P7YMV7_9HELO|nr:putative succinate dehydrogenase assembly factor 2, mitochondrial [Amylocarpus encephaloides]